jgi:hypothetical protein
MGVGEVRMSVRKETIKESRVAIKDCWHPYGLQGLSPEKFATIASLILRGKHGLIKFGRENIVPLGRA